MFLENGYVRAEQTVTQNTTHVLSDCYIVFRPPRASNVFHAVYTIQKLPYQRVKKKVFLHMNEAIISHLFIHIFTYYVCSLFGYVYS